MKCEKYYEIMSAYVDAEATALEQMALQEHLKTCPVCKQELASQYTLKDMLQEYPQFSGTINISSKVMNRIKNPGDQDISLYAGESTVAVDRKGSQLMAVAFMFVLTIAAVFSAHKANSSFAVANAQPDRDYANYIYDHVYDAEIADNYRDLQLKQASLVQ